MIDAQSNRNINAEPAKSGWDCCTGTDTQPVSYVSDPAGQIGGFCAPLPPPPAASVCPCCGYCPYCGRRNNPTYIPQPYYYPYTVTTGQLGCPDLGYNGGLSGQEQAKSSR